MHTPTTLAYTTGTERHLNFHTHVQIGILLSCRWVPGFRAISQVFKLFISKCYSNNCLGEYCRSICLFLLALWWKLLWLILGGVTFSPLKTKCKIRKGALLNTSGPIREGAPEELMCLSSLGAFWKSHTFTFHPYAKSRNTSHVLFTQEERTITINDCI